MAVQDGGTLKLRGTWAKTNGLPVQVLGAGSCLLLVGAGNVLEPKPHVEQGAQVEKRAERAEKGKGKGRK